LAQFIVRDGIRAPVVRAGHGFSGNQSIDNRFFSRLDGRGKKRIESVTREPLNGRNRRMIAGRAVAFIRARVRRSSTKICPDSVSSISLPEGASSRIVACSMDWH
jgi:hypothetical protein